MYVCRHALGRCEPDVAAVQIANEHQQHHYRRDETVKLAGKCFLTPPPFLICPFLRSVLVMDRFWDAQACNDLFICESFGHVLRVVASPAVGNVIRFYRGKKSNLTVRRHQA